MATSPIIRTAPSGAPYTYVPVSSVSPENWPVKKPPLVYTNTIPTESEQGQQPKWKPFTLKTPFILFFFLVTIAFISVIEALLRRSTRNNGLMHTKTLDDLTAWQSFSYRYLLAVISVLYGMAWASVDLDIKRLEPFFQLSDTKGATAANSLLLHYPFDFLATVPITALARRHWSVCCSGIALILIFWVITPVQSALFATVTVSRNITGQFTTYLEPLPFERQATEISAQYFFTAFSNIYLNEGMPTFTTREFVAVPFKPLDSISDRRDKETQESWTTTTRVYSSSIECVPTTQTYMNGTYDSYNISSNVDCSAVRRVTMGVYGADGRSVSIDGFGYNGESPSYYLSRSWCYNTSYFLLMWTQLLDLVVKPNSTSSNSLPPMELTAIFCKPKYFYTDTNVTVDAKTLHVIAKDPGEPVPFTQEDKIFDLDRFEHDWSLAKAPRVTGWLDQNPPHRPIIEWWNITSNPSPISTLAAGLSQDIPFLDLKDPKVLANVFQRAHQMLFAGFARATFQISEDANRKTLQGYRTVSSLAIIVVEVFARLLEGFLGMVAICFAILGVLIFSRHANLFSDPDSLAATMALVADSKALLRDFDGLGEVPKLKKNLLDRTYRLDKWDSNGYYRIDLEETFDNRSTSSKSDSDIAPGPKVGVRPLVLRTSVGGLLVIFLFLLLGFGIYLYDFAQKYGGLPTLSQNQVVVQIIFNFIPTGLATAMEPFWVLITRYFCVYQPYTQLAKGRASPSTSLGTKYTNVPPALVLFRAFRAKHYILFSLSVTALLCNVLAIALSSLFDQDFRPTNVPKVFTQSISPQINTKRVENLNISLSPDGVSTIHDTFRSRDIDPFSLQYSNITQNTLLPSWVSKDYYFLPFEFESTANDPSLYQAITRGFGISMDCQPLENDVFEASVYLTESNFNINITVPVDGNRNVRCAGVQWESTTPFNPELLNPPSLDFEIITGLPGQTVAGEFLMGVEPAEMTERWEQAAMEACGSVVVLGWSRAVLVDINLSGGYFGNIATFVEGSYKNVTLVCRPKVETAMFNVVVDASYRVQTYERVGSYGDPLQFFQNDTTLRNFTAQYLNGNGDWAVFHNDSTPTDYVSFLMDHILNLNISDPNTPIPDAATLGDGVSQIYARYFSNDLAFSSQRVFINETTPKTINGFKTIEVERIIMNKTMFYIAAIILALNAVVAGIAYIWQPKNFLPRFPDTLASEIAYFHASHALKDVSGTVTMGSTKRDNHLNRLGHTYGFGLFTGVDGKRHRGVERSSIIESYRE